VSIKLRMRTQSLLFIITFHHPFLILMFVLGTEISLVECLRVLVLRLYFYYRITKSMTMHSSGAERLRSTLYNHYMCFIFLVYCVCPHQPL